MKAEPDCKVQELCRQLDISPRHFRRIFSKETGLSPKQYQQQMRYRRAVEMIRAGKYQNLKDIAYQCGYYDQTSFIKEFKKMSGGKKPGDFGK